MTTDILGLVGLIVLFLFIMVGFPISFTLIFLSLVVGYIGIGSVVFNLMTLQFYQVMIDTVLSAVPFFLFMGYILEDSGLMNRLFKAFQMLLAPLSGSLYLATTFTATIFAAATGIVGSSVTLLGIMAAPTMKESRYDVRLSAGCITAGGTLGILIPPSIMLVVMGPVIGIPVTDLFAGAILPGLTLSGLYVIYSLARCQINPALGPPLPKHLRANSKKTVMKEILLGGIPVTTLIAATLGSILAGLATATEGAAVGAAGALFLSMAYRRLTWAGLRKAMQRTLGVSAMILLLVASSNFFGSIFSRLGSADMITRWLLGSQLDPSLMLAAILVVVFVLGWPLEWVPIVLIFVPILLPLVRGMGVDLLYFGILVAVTLQTAWLSPPVALSAYFLKGVVPEWKLRDIYLGMVQFMALQLIGVICVYSFPKLATWLPQVLK